MESATTAATPATQSRPLRTLAAAAPSWTPSALGVCLWVGLIAASHLWGEALNDSGARIGLDAPPLFGDYDVQLGDRVLIPVAAAGAIIAVGPRLAGTVGWHRLLALAALGAALWAVALALTEGPSGISAPLEGANDYLASVPMVGSPGEFLSSFSERIGDYATHVRSHPPGLVLALSGLDSLGLGGAWPAAVLVLALAASAVPAALISVRALAGEGAARRAAPYLVLAPAAVWIATTADALFMGVGAWAVAATVLAITSAGRRSDLLAALGGLAFGLAAMLSYGLVLLAAIPLAVSLSRRRLRPLLVAAAGATVLLVAVATAGFSWLDGYQAIREQYLGSVADSRPYDYFLANNLAAFALAVGPVAAIALARLRDRRLWLLVGGASVAIAIADLSGMSKGEVERIWLPFLPWILVATAALPVDRTTTRALLGTQAALAIAIQVGVRTIW